MCVSVYVDADVCVFSCEKRRGMYGFLPDWIALFKGHVDAGRALIRRIRHGESGRGTLALYSPTEEPAPAYLRERERERESVCVTD